MPEQNAQIWGSAIEERESVRVEKDSLVLRVRDLNVQERHPRVVVTEDA